MEEETPVANIRKQKPPREPPPSQEFINDDHDIQWIDDVKNAATVNLKVSTLDKINTMTGITYDHRHRLSTSNTTIQSHLLHDKIQSTYRTKHPQPINMFIPTPKQRHTIMSCTDSITRKWINDSFDPHKIQDLHTTTEEESIADKWDALVGRTPTIRSMDIKSTTERINICTDTVQSDTGANKAVTSNKSLLYAYSDIDPYPIGGVKADDIAIVCTGHGLLPWQTKEGDIIMVHTLYCKEVDGTIISPTTIIEQNQHKYYGFDIENNCDTGKGILTLKKRKGCNHGTFDMTLSNGLWYHNYTASSSIHASIGKMNDACFSNLWHGRLAHVGKNITSQIHKHVEGIERSISHNTFFKCGTCITNKMSKQPHSRTAKYTRKNKKDTNNTLSPVKNPRDYPEEMDTKDIMDGQPGQYFHMDSGFVCGT